MHRSFNLISMYATILTSKELEQYLFANYKLKRSTTFHSLQIQKLDSSQLVPCKVQVYRGG